MRYVLLLVCFIGAIKWAYTKDLDSLKSESISKNSINVEFIMNLSAKGRPIANSISYDRLIINSRWYRVLGTTGFFLGEIIPFRKQSSLGRVQPFTGANILLGKRKHFGDIGFGKFWRFTKIVGTTIIPLYASFQYNYYPIGRGFLYKIGYYPWITYTKMRHDIKNWTLLHTTRISIGYCF